MGNCCSSKEKKELKVKKNLSKTDTQQVSSPIKKSYSGLGPLRRGNMSYSRCSVNQNSGTFSRKGSMHLVHLVENLNRNAGYTEQEEKDDKIHEYIVWTLSKGQSGQNFWINNGKKIFTKDEIRKIGALSEDEVQKKDFLTKRIWAQCYIKSVISDDIVDNPFIVVSRSKILEDSLNQFQTNKDINLKRALHIFFLDEAATDVGGVYREWFQCIFREFFSDKRGLFMPNVNPGLGKNTIIINDRCEDTKENLDYYYFFGQLVAKALVDRITLNENLNPILLKILMKRKADLEDFKYYDIDVYSGLKELQKNKVNEPNLNLPFVWNVRNSKNEFVRVELVPNGANIPINDENKNDYINKVIDFVTYKNIQKKIDKILAGFLSLIPVEKLRIFTVDEFDFLLSGQSKIDLNDWKNNTEYQGGYSVNSKPVIWFWECLRGLSNENLLKFFTFCTGCARAPINGFRMLLSARNQIVKFTIEKSDNPNSLISAKTCFNRVILPEYKTKEQVKDNIDKVLSNDNNFFGMD